MRLGCMLTLVPLLCLIQHACLVYAHTMTSTPSHLPRHAAGPTTTLQGPQLPLLYAVCPAPEHQSSNLDTLHQTGPNLGCHWHLNLSQLQQVLQRSISMAAGAMVIISCLRMCASALMLWTLGGLEVAALCPTLWRW
jgi:hypothetical protein